MVKKNIDIVTLKRFTLIASLFCAGMQAYAQVPPVPRARGELRTSDSPRHTGSAISAQERTQGEGRPRAAELTQVAELPHAKKKAVPSSDFFVSASEYDFTPIALEAIKDATSKYDKAKGIFLWICRNIKYDTQTDIRTSDECWRQRRGVCQGYCELYYRMAEAVGLKASLVYGMSRNAQGGAEEHAWLSVETEKGDILLDPTWGAGSVVNGEFRHLPTPLTWFDVDPLWLIFTHMPKKAKYQHLSKKVSEEQYASLCYASPLLERVGLTSSSAMQLAQDECKAFPFLQAFYARALDRLRFVDVPQSGRLKAGTSYKFVMQKLDDNFELYFKNADDVFKEEKCERSDSTITFTLTPSHAGKLELVFTALRGYVRLNNTLVEYAVEE